MKQTKCLLCGATAELHEQNYPGYQEPQTFDIYCCRSCNTSFPLPRVDSSAIYDRIYQYGAEVPAYDRYWQYKDTVKTHPNPIQYLHDAEEAYWGGLTVLKKKVKDKKNAKILEIGCGMGYLTYSLVKDGYNATGLDISQSAVDEAIRNFGEHYVCADIFKYAEEHRNYYDVVIMTEVIEHVDSPLKFLNDAIQLVSGEGVIIVTTPNKTIYPNDIIWNTELPPVHCWWFSETSMQFMADTIRCKVSFVDFSDFYKKRATIHNVARQQIASPVFDINGKIVPVIHHSSFIRGIRQFILRLIPIPLLRYYRRLKAGYNPDFCFCGKRGLTICAVFQKT
jgi:SAM-dependent methyltransferase